MGNVVATEIGTLTNEDFQGSHPDQDATSVCVTVASMSIFQHENMDRDRLYCGPYDRSRAAGLLICNRTRRVQLRVLVHSVDLSARGNVGTARLEN